MLPILFKIPKIFGLGPFPVHSFGVMIVIAFFVGLWLCQRRAAQYGVTKAQISDVCFLALISGVLGARLAFIIQELPYYTKHLNELFSIEFKGMTSFGGPILGFFVIWWWAKKNDVKLSALLDIMGPGFMLGHVVGRFGCLLNGCCFGGACPTGYPLGIHILEDPLHLHHPAQIYDSAMNLIGLLIVLRIEKMQPKPLVVFSSFLMLHAVTRFIYEFWRAGTPEEVRSGLASSTYWGSLPITEAQGMALALFALGAFVFWRAKVKHEVPIPA